MQDLKAKLLTLFLWLYILSLHRHQASLQKQVNKCQTAVQAHIDP